MQLYDSYEGAALAKLVLTGHFGRSTIRSPNLLRGSSMAAQKMLWAEVTR